MTNGTRLKPTAFGTIVYGGLAVGVLDFLDANIFFGLWYGIKPIRIWWTVASGLIGRDRAFSGGLKTALLGVFLHFVISFIIATVFYFGSRLLPFLISRPVVWGLLYGVVCYFVMTFVVVPLSRVGPRPFPELVNFLNGIIGHAVLIGLPVAILAARSAKANRRT